MKKNKIQFQKGYSLPELMQDYGTEEQCQQALFKWRWSSGFICSECGSKHYCSLKSRQLYQCNHCHHQTSVISGTIFAATKLPLTTWFLAIYLLTQGKTSISALALKRQLGVSYNTAWMLKHKIMQVMMEQDNSRPLYGLIQMDDAYYGGEQRGGKRGRGAANKVPFVAAVACNEQGHPMKMRMSALKGFTLKEITRWSKKHLVSSSSVISDGLACFSAVSKAGCQHDSIVTGGGPSSVQKEEFLWVNTMIGNVKNAITGTYHSVSISHLPRYLAEFCYRFNRRFDLRQMIPRFMSVAARTPPMPMRLLKLAEDCG
ncbi:MAG: IS1595 family transposase [Thiotrichaceae bacterium]